MMKKALLLAALICGLSGFAQAKDGYKITVKFTDLKLKDSLVYLAHYFGKPLPTIYKADSAKFDKNNTAVFESKNEEIGGIYIILLSDHKTYFEFLLTNGDEMSITANSTQLPTGLEFKGSPENERFIAYQKYLQDFGTKQNKLQSGLAAAKTASDTAAIRAKAITMSKELMDYRTDYMAKYPNSLLADVFSALWVPTVPEGKHLKADGTTDSSFAYKYYKAHFWDKFNFKDNRLVQTPIYEAKIEEYFNKLVLPLIDSMKYEADLILEKSRPSKDLFKYNLWWITRNAENSKIMGMDELFVYLVEKYYMKGDAHWLGNEDLQKYIDRAQKIAPNVIGNIAPEINMQDISGKKIPLSSVKSKYTLVVFWTPSCGHCQQMVPKVDSVYRASLKAKGVKIYAIRTEDDPKEWQDFIKSHKLEDWINVYDPNHTSDFRSKYDVYSTPVIYLLDEKKKIIGKRLDQSNIEQVIENYERKNKSAGAN
jgi:thiol-disulfide isomerase/thioredoxin